MKPKPLSGFKGMASMFQDGDLTFMVVTANVADAERVWNALFQETGEPFDPSMCKPSILIPASALPLKVKEATPPAKQSVSTQASGRGPQTVDVELEVLSPDTKKL